MQDSWVRVQLRLLAIHAIRALAHPSPALLPRPLPPTPASLAVPIRVWEDAIGIVFPNAVAIQWCRVEGSAPPRSTAQHHADDAFAHLSVAVARGLSYHLGLPFVLWTARGGALPADALRYSFGHREDNQGRYFLVIASYREDERGDGSAFIRELVDLPLWFSRARYILVLDTGALPEARRCDEEVAAGVAAALWRSSNAVVCVILARCTWRVVMYSAYEEANDKRRVIVHQNNVSMLEALMDSSRATNFHDRKWRISIFPSNPTLELTVAPGQPDVYSGVDGWVMATAADYFHFVPEILFPEDQDARGVSDNKGNGTGTLGPVMTGQAVISFNSRFVKDYNTTEIKFSYPYVLDELCVMVPRSDRIPNYITIFRIYSVQVWAGLLVVLASATATTVLLDSAHGARRPVGDATFAVYSMLLSGTLAGPYGRARDTSTLLLLGTGLLFNIVFMGAFQGLLFKSLTMPQYWPETDTLSKVADSGIPITTRSRSLSDTFDFDDAPVTQRLKSNFKVVAKNWTTDQPFAVLSRRYGAYLPAENKAMHLVDECPRKYMLSYITHRNFPFLPELNMFLLRCMDAGLMSLWLDLTYEAAPEPRVSDDMVLSVFEVEAAFFLLATSHLGGAAVFLGELLWHHCCRPEPPRRNKGGRRRRRAAPAAGPPPSAPSPPSALQRSIHYYYNMRGGASEYESRHPEPDPGSLERRVRRTVAVRCRLLTQKNLTR